MKHIPEVELQESSSLLSNSHQALARSKGTDCHNQPSSGTQLPDLGSFSALHVGLALLHADHNLSLTQPWWLFSCSRQSHFMVTGLGFWFALPVKMLSGGQCHKIWPYVASIGTRFLSPRMEDRGLNPTGSQSHWEEAAVIPIMPA